MVKWLVESPENTGLTVCRIKNKFLLAENEVTDGYRDVALNVVFEDDGLKIIGEIQIHDKRCIPHTLWDCLQGFASVFNVR